ncbi:LysE family transporter [Vibrio profundum]|uniref:LysE family translocator n=1 Tax=Vibrio profundum TaxID=2910247 RepID=UPI003D0992D0
MFPEYFAGIATVTAIAMVMVISPGQDFAMISRNSLLYSRKAGLMGALGISAAVWLHVTYSLAGIAFIILHTPVLYGAIKYTGAAYLAYLGIKALFSKKEGSNSTEIKEKSEAISNFTAFRAGFISNALNPKTTLFFLSIFTQVVTVDTPLSIQVLYGVIISIAHLIWFSLVAYLLSTKAVLRKVDKVKVWVERVMGTMLCLLASKIALT